ncbi:MAG: SirB2 family protein [Steroidobacteraceae bacterium]
MLEFYPQIKWIHLLAVTASGSIFLLRGLGILAGQRWPMHALPRYLSYSVDTVLLSAALVLVGILPPAVFANGWLWVKLALLAAYIVLASFALKRARSPRGRQLCFCGAVLVFVAIILTARSHDPWGAVDWMWRK